MKEISDEIKLTLDLMQTYTDDGGYGELQGHLYSLLEIKRDEIQKRLTEPVAKPLTSQELKAGGWWCKDVSEDCANAFKSKGLRVFNSGVWGVGAFNGCEIDEIHGVSREWHNNKGGKKLIHRVNNEFYWDDDPILTYDNEPCYLQESVTEN